MASSNEPVVTARCREPGQYARGVPKVIYNTATSLNGFIADPAGSLSWLFEVPLEGAPDNEEFMRGVSVLVYGSTTYEWVLREENLLEEPAKWQGFYGSRPTFVFTSRQLPCPAGADVHFASGAVAEHFPAISAAAGEGNVWVCGGGDLVGQFHDAGLLDEIRLSVAPVALAGGAPLLPRTIRAEQLTLTGARPAGAFAELTYAVRR
jgi:dihydrofolate reductase